VKTAYNVVVLILCKARGRVSIPAVLRKLSPSSSYFGTHLGGRVSVLFPEIHMDGKIVKIVANKICPPAGTCCPPFNLTYKTAVFDPAVPK